jgi:hypothetical protein
MVGYWGFLKRIASSKTKDKPSDRYKGNQQDDVAAGNKQPQRTVKLR